MLEKYLDTDFAEIRIFFRDEKSRMICSVEIDDKIKDYIGNARDLRSVKNVMYAWVGCECNLEVLCCSDRNINIGPRNKI